MELPDDVLQLVRAYAKPTEQAKRYTRVLKILKGCLALDTRTKLKTAVRFHFETFLPIFLELERTHAELVAAVDSVMRNNDARDTRNESEVRMEYYRKRQNYTFKECAVMNLLNTV